MRPDPYVQLNLESAYMRIVFCPNISEPLQILLLEVDTVPLIDVVESFDDDSNEDVEKDKHNNHNEGVKVDIAHK